MKMLICLHGNPLQGQEFESMIPALQSRGFHPIIHKRLLKKCKLEPLIQSINATVKVSGGGPFGILAYSWGAYLALAYLHRFPENVTGLTLINPLLVDHRPLGPGGAFVLKTPLLRSIVLKLRGRKMANAFLNKVFDPEMPSQVIKNELESYLSQAQVWQTASAYKKIMQTTPLPNKSLNLSFNIRALFGEKDQVVPYQPQLQILSTLADVQTNIVSGAGHALPWTHPGIVLDEITKTY